VIFGETRNGAYKFKQFVRIGLKDNKRCVCVTQLSIASYHKNMSNHLGLDVVEFKFLKYHTNHVPGDSIYLLKRYTSVPLNIEVGISNELELEQYTPRVAEEENDGY
jgi:hypothetical protein